jgi:hypothetical protein
MARDWNPDMANWAMYTPWPFSDLFQELGDKVEVFDFEKYNFVTPIMKPDAMDRAELLDRVMNNYRRFFMNKSFFQYPWEKDKLRRKYLMGCLKAFLKSGFERTFYDLGRVGYWGPQSKKKVDFAFDTSAPTSRPAPRPSPRPMPAGSRCTARRSSTSGARVSSTPPRHHRQIGLRRPWPRAAGRQLRRPRPAGKAEMAAAHAGGIGPNAIIRVAEVLPASAWACRTTRAVRARRPARYLAAPPQHMVDETEVRRCMGAAQRAGRAAWPPRWRAKPACAPPTTCWRTASRSRCRRC